MKKILILTVLFVATNVVIGQSIEVKNSTSDSLFVITDDGKIGINTTSPDGALDISLSTGALIIPRMTTAERATLPLINGSIIYNTTDEKFNFREDGVWVEK